MHFRLLSFSLILALAACQAPQEGSTDTYRRISGPTMGTTYHITYRDSLERDLQTGIDSLLVAFNLEVSTYIDTSIISLFNRSAAPFDLPFSEEEARSLPIPAAGDRRGEHFAANYAASLDFYHRSQGAFDPTVMPLVNFWGFGYTEKKPVTAVDSAEVAAIRALVGMDQVLAWDERQLIKTDPGVQLDFSAIAKGYGVDLAGIWLEAHGIHHYLVEIGGEVRARGRNERGEAWTIGINTPDPGAGIDDIQVAISLEDRSLATSGNYRNFYEFDGRKYAHTINPATGYPELSNLLSASVFAPTCTEADALATACMVMGLEKAWAFVQSQPELEAYFIFGKEDGTLDVRYTEGLEPFIKK